MEGAKHRTLEVTFGSGSYVARQSDLIEGTLHIHPVTIGHMGNFLPTFEVQLKSLAALC